MLEREMKKRKEKKSRLQVLRRCREDISLHHRANTSPVSVSVVGDVKFAQ